jgi:membrane-bound lytic murein transglycosylase B
MKSMRDERQVIFNSYRPTVSRSSVRIFALVLACAVFQSPALAQEMPSFDSWLQALKEESLQRGISAKTVERAFSEITPPVARIVENDRQQPEVVQTYADYLGARVADWKGEQGLALMEEHSVLLDKVARAYGVQARFIVAIWGMETNFGTYPLREPLFNVLATLAYDQRRGDMFRAQFLAALSILDSGYPPYEKMKSSWAGAMGQPQFMPESYLEYAVDFDGDGNRNIWDSRADVFASIANYFKTRDWKDDQTWGRKVALPANGENTLPGEQADGLQPDPDCARFKSLGVWRDLQEWQKLGVRRENGSALPRRSIPAALVIADPGDNEGYLVYRNFCTIMSYNPSFKYALSIGLLSDMLVPEQN